nr:hypothetical protein CFP56_73160 [Quercus suber]
MTAALPSARPSAGDCGTSSDCLIVWTAKACSEQEIGQYFCGEVSYHERHHPASKKKMDVSRLDDVTSQVKKVNLGVYAFRNNEPGTYKCMITPLSNMVAGTTHYNVYRVQFLQRQGPNHEGLALVPAHLDYQEAGRFYHVWGDVGMGMDYQLRPSYNFGRSSTYQGVQYLFKISLASLSSWEEICSSTPAPHDSRVLMETSPDPPAPDCTSWVEEVVRKAASLAE